MSWKFEHEIARQFDSDRTLYMDKQIYLALFDASACHCAEEIGCETMAKGVKNRLGNGRSRLSRDVLDKEVFIQFNGPQLFEMDLFIDKCSEIFQSR